MPHGKLSPPRFSIRNQQRSQINADNQQHEEHGAGEKNQGVALIADDILVQRSDDSKMSLRVMIGILLRPVPAQRLQLRISLLSADAIAQPRDGDYPMTPSIDRCFLRIDRQRCPHLHAVVTKPEALRHYANHFAWRIVEPDRRRSEE